LWLIEKVVGSFDEEIRVNLIFPFLFVALGQGEIKFSMAERKKRVL
jgi:hypothetical protein